MKNIFITIGLFVIFSCNAQLHPGQSITVTCQADSLMQVISELNIQKTALEQTNQQQMEKQTLKIG